MPIGSPSRLRAQPAADGAREPQAPSLASRFVELRDDLAAIASSIRRGTYASDTFTTQDTLQELYLRLTKRDEGSPPDLPTREQFVSYAATAIGNILRSHRRKPRLPRCGTGGARCEHLDQIHGARTQVDLSEEVHALLKKMAKGNRRAAEVVWLRYGTGMEFKDIALALGISERTVFNDWKAARDWLAAELTDDRREAARTQSSGSAPIAPA